MSKRLLISSFTCFLFAWKLSIMTVFSDVITLRQMLKRQDYLLAHYTEFRSFPERFLTCLSSLPKTYLLACLLVWIKKQYILLSEGKCSLGNPKYEDAADVLHSCRMR